MGRNIFKIISAGSAATCVCCNLPLYQYLCKRKKNIMGAVVKLKQEKRSLTEGPIFSTLISFAIPIILANIIQQLYSLVDLAVAGKYVGAIGTVGVNSGSELADIILILGTAFATSGQIYISQQIGAKDEEGVKHTTGTLLTFTTLVSILAAVGCIVFSTPFLKMINCPEDAFSQAQDYMVITALGFPFIFGYNSVCGILRGMGDSQRPLLFVTIAATANIFADLLFVVVFHLEAAGTAIATVLSQMASFFAAFVYLKKQEKSFGIRFDRSLIRMHADTLKILLKLAIPQMARSIFVRSSLLWINANLNGYGTAVSAANGVGNKIQKFSELAISGVDQASGAMIGQNLGARKPERAKKVTLYTLVITMICAATVSIIGLLFPRQIFGLFSNDELVLSISVVYMQFMVIHFFSSAFVGSFQAMVTGCGFVSLGFAIGILDGVVCKIGLSLIFVPMFEQLTDGSLFATICSQIPLQTLTATGSFGYMGYFLGIACSRILPGFLCFGYFLSGKWRTRKLLVDK